MRWAIGTGMVTRNQEDDQHFHLIVNRHWREMLSIGVSILSLSWGYTSHYRRSKNGALGMLPTLIYFTSTLLFVFTRILCFEMFAYSVGPGKIGLAMVFVGIHVIMMAVIDFIFSYSIKRCQETYITTEIYMLDLYSCFVNGLANLFVYNHINHTHKCRSHNKSDSPSMRVYDTKSVSTYSTDASLSTISTNCSNINIQSNFKNAEIAALNSTEKGDHTLVRQFLVESVFLLENVAMTTLARRLTLKASATTFNEIYSYTIFCVCLSYTSAMFLKVLYYSCFHPWSELIRQRFFLYFVNQ